MKKIKSILFVLLISLCICLTGCANDKNTTSDENSINIEEKSNEENEVKNEDTKEKKIEKQKVSFNSEKTGAKFEYSDEFALKNVDEVKESLTEYDIDNSNNDIKEILATDDNDIILVSEISNEESLEQIKKEYETLASFDEFQMEIEKNEIVSTKNGKQVLRTVMKVQDTKMQIITGTIDNKAVVIQYVCSLDNYDEENAKIIFDSVEI